MKRKQYTSTALIVLFCLQIIIVAVSVQPYLTSTSTNSLDSENKTVIKDDSIDLPLSADTADSWWNYTFNHRLLVSIYEPHVYHRTNEPVEVYLEFEDNTHRIDSTRLVKYSAGTWTTQKFQLSNVTHDGTYIQSFTITFLVTINLDETLDYYIYYSDEVGIEAYGFSSSLSTNFDGTTLSIDNGHYELELAENSAIYKYAYEGTNYHTDSSFSPLSQVIQSGESLYTPDIRGFITDWLLVGPFDEPFWWGGFASVTNTAHLDLTKDYMAGDYATGGNASQGLDPSLQWFIHNDADYVIDLDNILGGNTATGYGMVYVYAPTDFTNIYLKLAADDGIGVIMDHKYPRLFYYPHSSPPTQSLGNQDRWDTGPFNMSQGWHSFIVFCEEYRQNWEFTMRFSTDGIHRSFTDSTNAITNIAIALAPQTEITQIVPEVNGPIYSKYSLNWTKSQDMTVYDMLTFYENLNMWKCERTIQWDSVHTSPDSSSFSAINTYYNESHFEEFLYNNQRTYGLTNQITAQNYALIRDFDGSNSLTTLGLFLTNIKENSPNINLEEIYWTSSYQIGNPDTVNIVPGSETDLDNSAGLDSVTLTFWEYLDNSIGIVNDYAAALSYVNGIYNGLKNPLAISTGMEEDLFYSLTVNCKDHDGSNAVGINVTLVNITNVNSWDNSGPQTLTTDENGEVFFDRLKEASYNVSVSYEKFGTILYFDNNYTIDPLDSSQYITITDIALTKLDLNLQSSGDEPEPIIGAIVTIYKENSTDAELLGNIISDTNGVASLYWSNLSASENYTFSVTFLGDLKWINVTGNLVENYSTPLQSYTNLIVTVQIEDFATLLLMESGAIIDSYTWGESFDVNVYYYFEVTGSPTSISGATVTYKIPGYVDDPLPLAPTGSPGHYSVTIDSSHLTSQSPLIIYVTATSPGYTPVTNSTLLDLQSVPLEILPETTYIERYWLENFTIQVQLNDTYYDQLITSGTVSYTVSNNPTVYGELVQYGDYYEATINTTVFGSTGTYVLNLIGSNEEYTTPSAEITLKIKDIYTKLNGTIFLLDDDDFYVTTAHSYQFFYTSLGIGIAGANTLDWELQDNRNNVTIRSGSLIESSTLGIYEMSEFDSRTIPVGSYSLVVRIGANNFIERQAAINIDIMQIPIQLQKDITGDIFTAPKGDLINISLQLLDPVYNTVITGATVTIAYDGHIYNMTEVGTSGTYYHTVDTNAYKTLAVDKIFEATIAITVNMNYTINDIPVTIQIRPPLGPFGIPVIYWLIGGSVAVIALGAFAITKGIQYARIPWIIKQITATRKTIKRKTRFTPVKITRSLDEVIADDAEAAFSILDLSLKEKKPKKGVGKSKDSLTYKDLEEYEGGNH